MVRQLEIALSIGHGTGEAAFRMAEEFAFEKLRRDGRHVDGDEGLAGPWTEPVDGAGEQFFPCSRFAEHKDRQRRLGPFLEIPIETQESGILGGDA